MRFYATSAGNLRHGACGEPGEALPVAHVLVLGRTRVRAEFEGERSDEQYEEGEDQDFHARNLGSALD